MEAAAKQAKTENGFSKFVKNQAIWLVWIVLMIAFTIASPNFLSVNNIMIMLRQVAVWGIASVGMMFVILLGEIDLSVGSLITFVNIMCAMLMVNAGMNMWIAVIITLIVSIGIGLLNGFMVSTLGIPSLIATFASQTALAGIALLMCGGQPVS